MNDARLFLAHSRPSVHSGGSPQQYSEHVENVRHAAEENALVVDAFSTQKVAAIAPAVGEASVFHDLGKLEDANQRVLSAIAKKKHALPIDHVDAGVCHLWKGKSVFASLLVSAHHRPGLADQTRLRQAGCDPLHELRHWRMEQLGRTPGERNEFIQASDSRIDELLKRHDSVCSHRSLSAGNPSDPIGMRLALSCLVDADHSDSAAHDKQEPKVESPQQRWDERLASLRGFVGTRSQPVNDIGRFRSRQRFLEECLNAQGGKLVCCEGPVGIGKTTSVMAHLLVQAQILGLRRIFVVAPFTAIINQTVQRLRESLVLEGETADNVIAAHHHQADFETREARHLAQLWNAPIVVTTAVQFFETLAASSPGKIRKLHSLAGSGIFIDEAHAALPPSLWPLAWQWLEKLTKERGCRVVLASGTMVRFWKMPEMPRAKGSGVDSDLPVLAVEATTDAKLVESRRVRLKLIEEAYSSETLIDAIEKSTGPRVVILNTTSSAAALADAMNQRNMCVEHMSTLLCPGDRDALIGRLEQKLDATTNHDKDWTLVATSCIEAGVDLSFQTGFREAWSVASLLQTSGRINREGNLDNPELFSFTLHHDELYRAHPNAEIPAEILKELFEEDAFGDGFDASEVASEAFRRELQRTSRISTELLDAEKSGNFPKVAKDFRVIEDSGYPVIVDAEVIKALKDRSSIPAISIRRGSISLSRHVIEKLGIEKAKECAGHFILESGYEPEFLGAGRALIDASISDAGGVICI